MSEADLLKLIGAGFIVIRPRKDWLIEYYAWGKRDGVEQWSWVTLERTKSKYRRDRRMVQLLLNDRIVNIGESSEVAGKV